MEPSSEQERELRAARNQSLFRALNEKLTLINEAVADITGTFEISERGSRAAAELLVPETHVLSAESV